MTNNEKTMVKFEGKCKWASVPPSKPRKPYEIDPKEPDNCSYSIEVECSEEKFKQLKKQGIPKLTELREDESTGLHYIRLRAAKVRRETVFEDIPVVDVHKKPITSMIANGSEVVVFAEMSDSKRGVGKILRLKAVIVTKLIPFDGSGSGLDSLDFSFQESNSEGESGHEINDMF